MDLDGEVIHNEGRLKGGGPEISTFLGPNGTCYARSHFRAQKSLDFRAHPFKRPSLCITPFAAEAVFCYTAENSHHLKAQVTPKILLFQEENISVRRMSRCQVTSEKSSKNYISLC